jgi:MinD superfamily P-loop ATPase
MILAVASGKGGTGKTTVSVNLASVWNEPVQLLDCDVEEPNAHLFLHGSFGDEKIAAIQVPRVDESLCNGCGECGKFCAFHAIVSLGAAALVFPEMCHGCGGCMQVCPQHAIQEVDHRIGVVQTMQSGAITLVSGLLDVGVAMAPPLIRAVLAKRRNDQSTIIDAPPGASCPVIASIRHADLVVLVTEPTPFGLHDLKLAVELVRELALPFGVVINRVGSGDDRVHTFCQKEKIPLLLEIPDDRRIAEAYSTGKLMVDALPEYRALYAALAKKCKNLVAQRKSS